MGFSGARIVELQLNADGRRLILKTTTRSLAPEARAAEAAASSKAHRTDFSYANEIAFLGAHAAELSGAGGGGAPLRDPPPAARGGGHDGARRLQAGENRRRRTAKPAR